ncbi:hypothetical protein OIU77_009155 [Salix suchowensis]|uniref:Reverse transcriptase zinc-binding domain-containing protein n=1 Tax=Salix suchowensis TaxID=1278906 RepID=A0ABQ9ADD8_9ROSI|nr:hypothetical protein OIU77_009155 [Salix suchowensis]
MENESHEHLFFQCSYANIVWLTINRKAGLFWPSTTWVDLIHWSSSHRWKKNSERHLIARLILAAVVYYIWLERNNRIFNNTYKSAANLSEEIFQLLRLHISNLSLKYPLSEVIKVRWNLNEDLNAERARGLVGRQPSKLCWFSVFYWASSPVHLGSHS